MEKKKKYLIAILLSLEIVGAFLIHNPLPVAYAASRDFTYVYDEIDLFSDSEEKHLESLAEEYSGKRGLSFFIVTANYASESNAYASDPILYDTEDYSEAFYQALLEHDGRDYKDCIIFTINIVDPNDSDQRYADVSGQGEGKRKMDNKRCSLLFDRLKGDLSHGNYYSAACEFVTRGARYVKVRPGLNPEGIYFKLWFQILVSLLVSLAVIAAMISRSKGRMTVSGNNYLDHSNARILGRYDRFLHTTTTRTKIERSSGGGGGGHSGGGGGGGGSHGGGHF